MKPFNIPVDISTIGLTDLRQGLSIIPQEPILFSGTIRSNLDPFNTKVYSSLLYPATIPLTSASQSDPQLWDALRQAHLVDPPSESKISSSQTQTLAKFTLDTVIEDEGSNLSVGERCLVSLARALVRDAKIVVMDECTAVSELSFAWATSVLTTRTMNIVG